MTSIADHPRFILAPRVIVSWRLRNANNTLGPNTRAHQFVRDHMGRNFHPKALSFQLYIRYVRVTN